jgi:hypothetical protein
MFHLFLRRHVAATSGLQPQTHTQREVTNLHRVGAAHHLTINADASTTRGAMRTALACSRACEMRVRALLLCLCTRRMTKHTLAGPRHDTLQPDADRGERQVLSPGACELGKLPTQRLLAGGQLLRHRSFTITCTPPWPQRLEPAGLPPRPTRAGCWVSPELVRGVHTRHRFIVGAVSGGRGGERPVSPVSLAGVRAGAASAHERRTCLPAAVAQPAQRLSPPGTRVFQDTSLTHSIARHDSVPPGRDKLPQPGRDATRAFEERSAEGCRWSHTHPRLRGRSRGMTRARVCRGSPAAADGRAKWPHSRRRRRLGCRR